MSEDEETTIEEVFPGYTSPNYTQVPDELFDRQLPDLSGAELKVLLYIMRRTFGFKKDADNISLNQICRASPRETGGCSIVAPVYRRARRSLRSRDSWRRTSF